LKDKNICGGKIPGADDATPVFPINHGNLAGY